MYQSLGSLGLYPCLDLTLDLLRSVSDRVKRCILQQSEEQSRSNLHLQTLATGDIIIFIPNILFSTVCLFIFKITFFLLDLYFNFIAVPYYFG